MGHGAFSSVLSPPPGPSSLRHAQTFTKTSENSALPPTLAVMAEFADITTNLLKPYGAFSLPAALSAPAVQPYFKSLSLTDQPRVRPSTPLAPAERTKRLILSLALPSAADAAVRRAYTRGSCAE